MTSFTDKGIDQSGVKGHWSLGWPCLAMGGGTDMVGAILPKAVLFHVVGGRGTGSGAGPAFSARWGGRGR